MRARSWHFPQRIFLCRTAKIGFGIVVSLVAHFLHAQPIAQDTTQPNQFSFSCDVYFVDKQSDNAVINVEFSPGNRGWSGSVNFYTSNGTAQAGADYEPASGTLSFSGPGTPVPVINVPILNNPSHATNVTVELFLTNSYAIINRSHATLVIVDKTENPPLRIEPHPDGVTVSWPAIYENYVLEKSASFSGGDWSAVAAQPVVNNNHFVVYDYYTETPAFYRLRKNAAP